MLHAGSAAVATCQESSMSLDGPVQGLQYMQHHALYLSLPCLQPACCDLGQCTLHVFCPRHSLAVVLPCQGILLMHAI